MAAVTPSLDPPQMPLLLSRISCTIANATTGFSAPETRVLRAGASLIARSPRPLSIELPLALP